MISLSLCLSGYWSLPLLGWVCAISHILTQQCAIVASVVWNLLESHPPPPLFGGAHNTQIHVWFWWESDTPIDQFPSYYGGSNIWWNEGDFNTCLEGFLQWPTLYNFYKLILASETMLFFLVTSFCSASPPPTWVVYLSNQLVMGSQTWTTPDQLPIPYRDHHL